MLLLLVVSPVVVYVLWPSDEARIRKLLRETAAAVEAEDMDRVMSSFDFAYRDAHGLSYLLLKRTLKREFGRVSDIEVDYEGLTVTVRDKKAGATLDLRVIATMGEARGYCLGDFDTPFSISVGLRKTPTGKWLVVEAEYAAGWTTW